MGGALHGLRVVELAGMGPAPFAGMLLADLGAEVIRVDRPDPGSSAAASVAGSGHADPGMDRPGWPRPELSDVFGRGKQPVTADLKSADGAALVVALAAEADAFIEGFRPGVAERLRVGPADLLAANPRLVYGRMTGWGQDGPLAHTAGHDLTYLALTGLLHTIGPAGGPPVPPANLLGDFGGGGMSLALGVLAGIIAARRTGRGQLVDASIVDATALLGTMTYHMLGKGLWRDERGSNLLDGGAPFYSIYQTSDGGYLAVGALEPRFYQAFLDGLGGLIDPPDQYDTASWPRLRELIAARLATRTRKEWSSIFSGTDACVAPVLSLTEAAHGGHPHLVARGTFETIDGVRLPAVSPRITPA